MQYRQAGQRSKTSTSIELEGVLLMGNAAPMGNAGCGALHNEPKWQKSTVVPEARWWQTGCHPHESMHSGQGQRQIGGLQHAHVVKGTTLCLCESPCFNHVTLLQHIQFIRHCFANAERQALTKCRGRCNGQCKPCNGGIRPSKQSCFSCWRAPCKPADQKKASASCMHMHKPHDVNTDCMQLAHAAPGW